MAVAGAVKLEVIARAQENIRAVLKQSNAAIRKSADELKKAGVAQTKMGDAVGKPIGRQGTYRRALIQSADAASKVKDNLVSIQKVLALGVILAASKSFFEFAKRGAQSADQFEVLTKRIKGFGEVVNRVKKSTAGMLSTKEIQDAAAAFDAFGLDIKQLDVSLEQAAKTAIRTGQSAAHMVSSLSTGVARMSAPILDNLGIQLKLADVVARATLEFNKEAEALTDAEKKATLLKMSLEQLQEANASINLDDTATAQFTRFEAAATDLLDKLAQAAAKVGDTLVRFNTPAQNMTELTIMLNQAMVTSTADLTSELVDAGNRVKIVNEGSSKLIYGLTKANKAFKTLRERLDALTPEQKIAAWKAYVAQAEDVTAKHYAQIRSLYDLEDAYNSVAQAAEDAARKTSQGFGAGAPTGGDTGFVSVEDVRKLMKAEGEAAKSAIENQRRLHKQIMDIAKREASRRKAKSDAWRAQRARDKAVLTRILERHAAQKKKYLDQIDKQKDVNALEMLGTKAAKDLLKIEYQIRDIERESKTILDEAVAKEWAKVKIQGVRLKQQADEAKAEREKAIAEQQGIDSATHALALAHDMLDVDRIALELARETALIEAEAISDEEKRLLIELARVDAARELGEIERENRFLAAEALAETIGPSLGEAAGIFAKMDADLEALGRPKRYETVSKGFSALAAQSQEIAKASAQFANAVGKGDKEIAEGVAASLGAIQPAVAAFVKGTRDRALVMMAFELAMAVAEGVAGNYPAAVGHGIAAGMFGVVAGVSASQPTTAVAETSGGEGGLITPAGVPGEQEAQNITVNLGPGMILGLPQELGRAISDQINSMAGTGMEATSF